MLNYPSKKISEFLNFLSEAESHYIFCCEELNKQEKLTQDYLHSLELDDLKCKERSKVATKLSENRKERRYYKDIIEELQSIMEFMSNQKNKDMVNRLKQVLGDVRKAENYHKNRTYIPRVLKEKGLKV